MNGEKPRYSFGGNQKPHQPMMFGPQQRIHGGPKTPEHFKEDEGTQKAILAELREINAKLSILIEKLGASG